METFRNKLKQEISKSYKLILGFEPSVPLLNAILRGDRKPNPEVRFDLHQRGIIPFTAWLDIKSYLNGSTTSGQTSRTNNSKNLPKEELC